MIQHHINDHVARWAVMSINNALAAAKTVVLLDAPHQRRAHVQLVGPAHVNLSQRGLHDLVSASALLRRSVGMSGRAGTELTQAVGM